MHLSQALFNRHTVRTVVTVNVRGSHEGLVLVEEWAGKPYIKVIEGTGKKAFHREEF